MMAPSSIVGVLLAGGRSSRFGGGDKCLLPLAGKPLLGWAIERLRPQVETLILNANGEPARFAPFGLSVVPDDASDTGEFAGPLAGVVAGMRWAVANRPGAKAILTAAADTPFLPHDLAERLLAASQQTRLVVARSAAGIHPVFGIWPLALEDALRAALEAGRRKMRDLAAAHGAIAVEFPPVRIGTGEIDPFFNINRPDDLVEAEALLAAQGA